MWQSLPLVLDAYARDPEVRVIVLKGAGEKAFSAGADLKSPPGNLYRGVPGIGVPVDKPVIGAVAGWVVGGGMVLTTMCDLLIAADTTRFSYPEVKVGFTGGLITNLAARKLETGRVLAIEPTAAAFDRLTRNIAHNGIESRAIAWRGVAAAEAGELTLNVVEGREEYSSLGAIVHPSVEGETTAIETVPAQTIDALVREHDLKPAVIKIDVEGAEMDVLRGARETLKIHRPVVISEVSAPLLRTAGASPAAIVQLFDALEYDVRDPNNSLMDPRNIEFGDIVATPRPRH